MGTAKRLAIAATSIAVIIVARPTPVPACMCDVLEPAELDRQSLADSELVFDGWVIRREASDVVCPLPPAPPAKRGCLRVRIHQRPDCSPMTYPAARLDPIDSKGDTYRASSASDDGVTELCGVKKGRYVLTAALALWATDPDGTLEHGIIIDFDPAKPQSYSAVATPGGGGWIVAPFRVLKGTVGAREIVIPAVACQRYLFPRTAYRFAVSREADGKLRLPMCGTRMLSEDEIKATALSPAAVAPPSAAPPPQPPSTPPARSSDGGCNAGTDSGGAFGLVFALLAIPLFARKANQVRRCSKSLEVGS